jgi:purine-nucleoside phosphorylase
MSHTDELNAARFIEDRASNRVAETGPRVAIILGSGWGDGLEDIAENNLDVPYSEVPGLNAPSVAGHAGFVRLCTVQGIEVLCFAGRSHYYETRNAHAATAHVRIARAMGAEDIIITNGAGATHEGLTPGDVVLITDHINMTLDSPLVGPRFVSMTDAYNPSWRAALSKELAIDVKDGVYVQMPGPNYETPAEVKMARTMGADLVGMSTALETIEARNLEMNVLGLSLVTNYGAGVFGSSPSHGEVVETGTKARTKLSSCIAAAVVCSPTSR